MTFRPQTEAAIEAKRLIDDSSHRDGTEHALLGQVAKLLAGLPVSEYIELGFSFSNEKDSAGYRPVYGSSANGISNGGLFLVLSSERSHRALLWKKDPFSGAWLWLDEHFIEVPLYESDRSPANDANCHWVSDRLLAFEITLEHHPRQVWSAIHPSGIQRGLLLIDAQTRRQRVELPGPDELWAAPRACLREGQRVEIFADREARKKGEVARVIPTAQLE